MQNFSYNFHSFCFLLNKTSNIYHLYQILISDSPRSRLPGSLLQTQGTSRYCATFLSQISFLPLSIESDIINKYHSYQILISDFSRSRLPGSLPQTQGTSKWFATFLLQISFLPFPVTLDIKFISFIKNLHIRILQIKAYRVTTSNSGNFKVLCNISIRNFVPSTSSHNRHQRYIIYIESSYQNPPDQGFQGHYFKRRELQGIMQHFSHKFHSFRFKLHQASYVYHSYQILISDSSRSRLLGSPLQSQRTSRYYDFSVTGSLPFAVWYII